MKENSGEFETSGAGRGASYALVGATLAFPAGIFCYWLVPENFGFAVPVSCILGILCCVLALILAPRSSDPAVSLLKTQLAFGLMVANAIPIALIAFLAWALSHGPPLYLFGAG